MVAIVTVKDVALPPARARVAGLKVQDAFGGKLPQVRLRVPEYPFAGKTESAYVAARPAVTVLLVLPPVCVLIAKGVCVAVPERVTNWNDGMMSSVRVRIADAVPPAFG